MSDIGAVDEMAPSQSAWVTVCYISPDTSIVLSGGAVSALRRGHLIEEPEYRVRIFQHPFRIRVCSSGFAFKFDQARTQSRQARIHPPHHIRHLMALNRRRRRSERPSLRADLTQGQILTRGVGRHGRKISNPPRPPPPLRHVHLPPPISIQLIEVAPNLRRHVAREVAVDRIALLNLIAEQPG